MHNLFEWILGPQQPIWISDTSNLTVFGLLVTTVTMIKKRDCTQKGCWRIGIHPVEGTHFRTCHRHATVEIHDRLNAEHGTKYPDQHALLNR